MLTPKIITFVYWLMLLAAVIAGVGIMFSGQEGLSIGKFLGGIIFSAGGAVFAKIACEMLVVLFKMNEALQDLRVK